VQHWAGIKKDKPPPF